MVNVISFANGIMKFGEDSKDRPGAFVSEADVSDISGSEVNEPQYEEGSNQKDSVLIDFDSMTLQELKDYATLNGIDLQGKTLKDDVKAIVVASHAENASE